MVLIGVLAIVTLDRMFLPAPAADSARAPAPSPTMT
jgi:hypothetical protein